MITQLTRLCPSAGVRRYSFFLFFFLQDNFPTTKREKKWESEKWSRSNARRDALFWVCPVIQVLAQDECGFSIVSTPQAYRPWATRVNKKEKRKNSLVSDYCLSIFFNTNFFSQLRKKFLWRCFFLLIIFIEPSVWRWFKLIKNWNCKYSSRKFFTTVAMIQVNYFILPSNFCSQFIF